MTGWTKIARSTLLAVGAGAVLGLGMALAEPREFSAAAISAYGSLAAIVLLAGWLIWKKMGADPKLGWMALAAFALRLGLGIALSLLLPVIGSGNPAHTAGYIFKDAFERDSQAWMLAYSGNSLFSAFKGIFSGDQYGGMLFLSAGIYRIFSPELHRPWLILLVTASTYAVGVIFLYKTLAARFGEKAASLASWIYVLYPETILLGASQMRDPILIGLTAMMFYLVEFWRTLRWKAAVWLAVLMALTVIFSYLVALAAAAILAVWWWIDYSDALSDRRRRLMGWAFLALLGIAGVTIISDMMQEYATWDISGTIRNSGWIEALFETLPESLQTPFIVIYGLLQPVLPAALFDPSIPISTAQTTAKALGWYLILPVLFYAPIALWKSPSGLKRRLLTATLIFIAAWAVISSLRAGGDIWDNPRYRSLMIPWIALIAAWGWNYAREHHDRWLLRWYLVFGVFVIVFSNWYLYRNYHLGILIGFWPMIALIVGLSLVVLGEGVVEELLAHGKSRRAVKSP